MLSDVSLHVTSITGFRRTFKLHALVIVRSPFLSRLLHVSPSPEIVLPVEDGNVTEEVSTFIFDGPGCPVALLQGDPRTDLIFVFFCLLYVQGNRDRKLPSDSDADHWLVPADTPW